MRLSGPSAPGVRSRHTTGFVPLTGQPTIHRWLWTPGPSSPITGGGSSARRSARCPLGAPRVDTDGDLCPRGLSA